MSSSRQARATQTDLTKPSRRADERGPGAPHTAPVEGYSNSVAFRSLRHQSEQAGDSDNCTSEGFSFKNKPLHRAPLFSTFNMYFVSSWSAQVSRSLQSHVCLPLAHGDTLKAPWPSDAGTESARSPGQCGGVWQSLPAFHLLLHTHSGPLQTFLALPCPAHPRLKQDHGKTRCSVPGPVRPASRVRR